jgi:UV DNA damage endonuclease
LPERHGHARQVLAPQAGQHADFVNPFEFARLIAAAHGLPPFDIMLEAKAADMALLRLREDLRRYAPEAAALVW